MNTATLRTLHQKKIKNYHSQPFAANPIKTREQVADGSLYQTKPITIRDMVTRRINKSLSFCLIVTIVITFVSYYIAMNYEAKLNKLDSEIVRINTENQDLQADLDKYKSFNNVDDRVGKLQLLQKAEKVIEVTAMNTEKALIAPAQTVQNKFDWAIGY